VRRRSTVLVALLALAPGVRADSLRPAELYQLEARDWPCDQPYRAELPVGMFWNRPELLHDVPDWRSDADLRRLVETVTASDSATPNSIAAIRAFAAGLPAGPAEVRDQRLAGLYVTTPYNHVFAVDARTGRQLWHYALG
jgi:PQQ enzyme repeat